MHHKHLLNDELIAQYLLKEARWADSHGADAMRGFLGSGLLYYALTYMLKAKMCVCIGSGGGFVPRLMRQAQRDLRLTGGRTVLIDADTGPWCRPVWMSEDSFFRREYADIEILHDQSSKIADLGRAKQWKIDYLHIDGDHSHSGSMKDIEDYSDLMSAGGIITFHDTKPYNYYSVTCWKTLQNLREAGHAVIDFPGLGAGIAVIQLKGQVSPARRRDMIHRQFLGNFISTIVRQLKSSMLLLAGKKVE